MNSYGTKILPVFEKEQARLAALGVGLISIVEGLSWESYYRKHKFSFPLKETPADMRSSLRSGEAIIVSEEGVVVWHGESSAALEYLESRILRSRPGS